MTDDELNAIEAAANAATPGPWTGRTMDSVSGSAIHGRTWKVADATMYPNDVANSPSQPGYLPAHPTEHIDTDANAAFIAGARTWVPALLAQVRGLREAFVDMSKQRDECMQNVTNLIHAIEANLDSETAERVLNAAGYITQAGK